MVAGTIRTSVMRNRIDQRSIQSGIILRFATIVQRSWQRKRSDLRDTITSIIFTNYSYMLFISVTQNSIFDQASGQIFSTSQSQVTVIGKDNQLVVVVVIKNIAESRHHVCRVHAFVSQIICRRITNVSIDTGLCRSHRSLEHVVDIVTAVRCQRRHIGGKCGTLRNIGQAIVSNPILRLTFRMIRIQKVKSLVSKYNFLHVWYPNFIQKLVYQFQNRNTTRNRSLHPCKGLRS